MMRFSAVAIAVLVWPKYVQSQSTGCPRGDLFASCKLTPDPNIPSNIQGTVYFKQLTLPDCQYGDLTVTVTIQNMTLDRAHLHHGFHVHEFGNIVGGCVSAGGHFNPYEYVHGPPPDRNKPRHVGDYGNVVQDRCTGDIYKQFVDPEGSLWDDMTNIIGRAVVLHEDRDDYGRGGNAGSKIHGNAGRRIACCVIGRMDKPAE